MTDKTISDIIKPSKEKEVKTMLIQDLRDKKTNFINLKEGEVAIGLDHGTYIMKIIPIYCKEDKQTYNAIDLRDGDALAMKDTDEVTRVTATLTIEGV